MYKNFNTISVSSNNPGSFEIESFEQFFSIFHHDLKTLRIGLRSGRDNSIETVFFRRNSPIYNEVTKLKTKKQGKNDWLHEMLRKEGTNIDVEKLVPQIQTIRVRDFIGNDELWNSSVLFNEFRKLLDSKKLLVLLNIDQTVNTVYFVVRGLTGFIHGEFDGILKLIREVATKFKQLKSIKLIWRANICDSDEFQDIDIYKEKTDETEKILKKMLKKVNCFFQHYFKRILDILVNNDIENFKVFWDTMSENPCHRELREGIKINIDKSKYDENNAKKVTEHAAKIFREEVQNCCLHNDYYAWSWWVDVTLSDSRRC